MWCQNCCVEDKVLMAVSILIITFRISSFIYESLEIVWIYLIIPTTPLTCHIETHQVIKFEHFIQKYSNKHHLMFINKFYLIWLLYISSPKLWEIPMRLWLWYQLNNNHVGERGRRLCMCICTLLYRQSANMKLWERQNDKLAFKPWRHSKWTMNTFSTPC